MTAPARQHRMPSAAATRLVIEGFFDTFDPRTAIVLRRRYRVGDTAQEMAADLELLCHRRVALGASSRRAGRAPRPLTPLRRAVGRTSLGAADPARYDPEVPRRQHVALLDALAAIAPGTELRDGLDRILQASMGALVVVGDGPEVLSICSGGFLLDAAYSPQRLSELAKMDGAIILAADASRIARANVHLVPNPDTPTSETGTRHRTAERVACSVPVPVVAVSEDMQVINVYVAGQKYPLEAIPRLLNKANQALSTLERYRARLDMVQASLSALEVEDQVTLRDVVTVLQRTEMVRRIAEELGLNIIELGADGRLVRLQLEELMGGVADDRRLVIKDYFHEDAEWHLPEALEALADLETDDLLDLKSVAASLHLAAAGVDLDTHLQPRGHRLLARIPRIPESITDRIVDRFGNLEKLMRATIDDLDDVAGVGETRARAIKEGLSRLAESSILDRYS